MMLPGVTTRRIMILVVLVAVALPPIAWMRKRAEWLRSEATWHRGAWLTEVANGGRARDRGLHHLTMMRKYERAARRPWLSVEPDPPGPKE